MEKLTRKILFSNSRIHVCKPPQILVGMFRSSSPLILQTPAEEEEAAAAAAASQQENSKLFSHVTLSFLLPWESLKAAMAEKSRAEIDLALLLPENTSAVDECAA